MTRNRIALFTLALLVSPLAASAASITLVPSPSDLSDLDHTHYYTWGINAQTAGLDLSLLPITRATLTFKNISNWDSGSNDLWVDLLDRAAAGVSSGTDNEAAGDYFQSSAYAAAGIAHTALVHYHNLPTTAQTLSYTFNDAQMAALYGYLDNGSTVALGFDPDCHFYNSGVKLVLEYQPVPEPATVAVLLAGAVLSILRRRRK